MHQKHITIQFKTKLTQGAETGLVVSSYFSYLCIILLDCFSIILLDVNFVSFVYL